MSQQPKSPAVMIRVQRAIERLVYGENAGAIARLLMEEGWIDIDWAADHTRPRGGAKNDSEDAA